MAVSGRLSSAILLLALAFALVLVTAFTLFYFEGGRVDDSYILFRYAENLAAGEGFVWNPGGPPTAGATSLAYTWTLATAVAATGLPAPAVADAIGLAGAAATLVFIALALWTALPAGQRWVAAPIVLQLGLNPWLPRHALNGMETTLALACVALLAWLSLTALARRNLGALILGVLSGLSFLVRPDLPLLTGGLAGMAVLAGQPDWRPRRPLLLLIAAFIATVGAILAGHHAVFGTPVPLSAGMKAAPRVVWSDPALAEWTLNTLAHFLTAMAGMLLLALVFLIAAGRRCGRGPLVLILPGLAFTLYLLGIAPVMGFDHRFHLPLLPLIAILLGILAAKALERMPPDALRGPAAALGLSLLIPFYVGHMLGAYTHLRNEAAASLDSHGIHGAVGEALEPFRGSVTLATSESGLGPYIFGGRHLDLAGLNDAAVARLRRREDAAATFRDYLVGEWGLPDVWIEPDGEYYWARLAAQPSLAPAYKTLAVQGLPVHLRRDMAEAAAIEAALRRIGNPAGQARALDRRLSRP